jgi:2-haloalkanoic acid dehalogenase type II
MPASSSCPLSDFKVLTFDCYGTLIDWETGIWDAFQPLITRNGSHAVTRAKLLETFARCESEQEAKFPDLNYAEILLRVHAAVAARLGLASDAGLDEDFARSLPHWPAFPDTADALRVLKQHYKLVILSNVHRSGFEASMRKLGVAFDAVYTAEDIGSYKPSPKNFEYLLRHLEQDFGFGRKDILHTAQSLYHDHAPARRLGLANAWIDRQRLSESGDWGATAKVDKRPETDYLFFSMGEMARAVEAGD